jgi:hypothetical protein
VLKGLLIDKAVEMLFEGAGHFAWSPGTRSIQQTLWPLLRKALHPFSESGIGQVEGRGDGVDMMACQPREASCPPAVDPDWRGATL